MHCKLENAVKVSKENLQRNVKVKILKKRNCELHWQCLCFTFVVGTAISGMLALSFTAQRTVLLTSQSSALLAVPNQPLDF